MSWSFLNISIECMVLYASGADLDSFENSLATSRRRPIYEFMMRVTEEQTELKVDAAWYILGLFYERARQHEQAIKVMSEVELTDETFLGHLVLAYIHAVAGQKKKALELVSRLEVLKRWVSPFHIALIELALKNPKRAKQYLKNAIEMHDPWAHLLIDPRLKPLRTDPEFLDMFRRINLDPDLICKSWIS